MNIHPLLVHFPIGLLAVYSCLEMGAYLLPPLRRQGWVFPVKAFLLFTGVLASFVALATGGMAEDLISRADPRAIIVEMHSSFAGAATIAYLVLAAAYLVRVFDREGWWNRITGTNPFLLRIWNLKKRVAHFILDTWLLPTLALLSLILLVIAGSLGAAVVYGPGVDPVVSVIYHLFWVH